MLNNNTTGRCGIYIFFAVNVPCGIVPYGNRAFCTCVRYNTVRYGYVMRPRSAPYKYCILNVRYEYLLFLDREKIGTHKDILRYSMAPRPLIDIIRYGYVMNRTEIGTVQVLHSRRKGPAASTNLMVRCEKPHVNQATLVHWYLNVPYRIVSLNSSTRCKATVASIQS